MVLRWVSRAQGSVEAGLIYVERTILFLLLLYVTAEVAMRNIFNSPLPGHLEISELFIAASAFLGLSYAQARRGHVGIDILVHRLPARPMMFVDSMTLLLSVVAMAIIVWFGVQYTVTSFVVGDTTSSAGLPTWWSKGAVALGAAFLCIRLLVQIGENIDRLRRGELVHPLQQREQESEAI